MTLHRETPASGWIISCRSDLPQYSRSRLQSWIKEGRVLVNGAAAKSSLVLHGGESIEVSPADRSAAARPRPRICRSKSCMRTLR